MNANQELKEVTARSVFHVFALGLSEDIKEKNAHQQLYAALKNLDGDWYEPQGTEPRRIQFVQLGSHLACRSTVKPEGVSSITIEISAKAEQVCDIKVRLPTLRRERDENSKVKGCIAIEKKDKVGFYSNILNRNGMETLDLVWEAAIDETIFFSKNKVTVAVPVDDIQATVKIKDVFKFIDAILHGVGRYKTYGCGMISIIDEAN